MYHCFHPSYPSVAQLLTNFSVDFVFFVLYQGMQIEHFYPKADKRPKVKLFNQQIANRHCSK